MAVIKSNQPIKKKFVFKRGADFDFTIKVKDNLTTAKDTTGWSAAMTIRDKQNGTTYATLSVGSGITHTPANGLFVIHIASTTVDAYTFHNAEYDLILTESGGAKKCPFYGDIEVLG